MKPTGQDISNKLAADRLVVQSPDPAIQTRTSASGRSEVQPPDPSGQAVAVKKNWVTSLTGTTVRLDELDSDGDCFSDHTSPTHID